MRSKADPLGHRADAFLRAGEQADWFASTVMLRPLAWWSGPSA
jgi:hypothetical protein